ncbi:MAG: SDR family oxidoreductase [Bacilli bacterium]|nr:SDR family oxidoreductase [Bacilli bacterium]
MKKNIVLITGGSKGIGAATVEIFAKNNYNIVLNYAHDDEAAIRIKKEIESKYFVSVLLVKADVSKSEEVKQMVEKAIGEFGYIDVLVNNAGIAIDQTFEDKTDLEFKKVLDVNLIGPFLVSKEVGKKMQEQGHGKIINVTSTNGIDTPYLESMDYDASKAGLISLTRNLATAFAPHIQVNAVAPGWVANTEMNKELDEEFIKQESKSILLGRFAEPKEIASVIYFLSTEEARYINSTVIRIDGGLHI